MFNRIQKFITRFKKNPSLDWSDIKDPRHPSWVDEDKEISKVINIIFLGLLSNQNSLRLVETLKKRVARWVKRLVPEKITDTTMYNILKILDPEDFRGHLIDQIKEINRKKGFSPNELPCGVATIDGKNLATLDHDAEGTAQRHERKDDGSEYYLAKAIRSTLTSAVAKPCIDQMAIPPDTNEMGACKKFVERLHKTYGRSDLFQILDFDAGYTSLTNADYVDFLGYGYIMGLKLNQPELFLEARRLLNPRAEKEDFDAQTEWERRDGKWYRRRLYRTDEIAGYLDWEHLRQAWLSRLEEKDDHGNIKVIKDRYFITNLLWNYLKPYQILNIIRWHWGIENDTYNSLDLQWKEDHGKWCTRGKAVWVLGFLRLMAYNLVQYLRKRHLIRREGNRLKKPLSFRDTFDGIIDALIKSYEEVFDNQRVEYILK